MGFYEVWCSTWWLFGPPQLHYYYLYHHMSYAIILKYSPSNFVNSWLILELKHGIQAKENRMSLCLLGSKGVVKPQHVARSVGFLCCLVVCSYLTLQADSQKNFVILRSTWPDKIGALLIVLNTSDFT